MKIEIKNLTKKFKNNIVLDDINLNLESGKIYAFVGRNGSGKSVLLKLISGYYKPTSGYILFDGKKLNYDLKIPPSTRCLIENPKFIPSISGYENLKLLADINKKINKEDIYNTLNKVNLYSEKDKLYHKYSLGMKQKLGIAQVLMENPNIIILDEPFNGIENDTVMKIRQILLNEKQKNKIIIIASHIKEDIENFADVIYKFDNGKIYIYEKNRNDKLSL